MKHLNWKDDDRGGGMVAGRRARSAASIAFPVARTSAACGLKLNVSSASPGGPGRYAGCWDNKPIKHQPVARSWSEAIAVAEADNDQRRGVA